MWSHAPAPTGSPDNAVMWAFGSSEIAEQMLIGDFNRNNTMLLKKYIPFSKLALITVHACRAFRKPNFEESATAPGEPLQPRLPTRTQYLPPVLTPSTRILANPPGLPRRGFADSDVWPVRAMP